MTGETCTAKRLSELLGISERQVREFAGRGVIVLVRRGVYDHDLSIQGYSAHMREMAAGRGGESGVTALTTERARLAKEQADHAAAKNAELRRELGSIAKMERVWSETFAKICSRMMAVTSRVRAQIPTMNQEEAAIVEAEIRIALEEEANG